MSFAYPIKAILIYIAILFAPDDADRITLRMPEQSQGILLIRDGETWSGGTNIFNIDGESLVTIGTDGKELQRISDFVALKKDRNWEKNPSITLGGDIVLEKVSSGFTSHKHASGGKPDSVYQIVYHRSEASAGEISVNVLGEVVGQGVHRIPANGTVKDAIAAAGGPSPIADMKHVSIIRGAAGSVPEVTTVELDKADATSPNVQAGDTVHVAKKDDPKSAIPNIRLVGNWLEKIDHRDMGQAWDMAADFFQKNVTREQWEALATAARKPLGSVKKRRLLFSMTLESLPGAPDGVYQVYEFESSFDNKKEAKEVVTFAKEKDGTWKPAGYFIE